MTLHEQIDSEFGNGLISLIGKVFFKESRAVRNRVARTSNKSSQQQINENNEDRVTYKVETKSIKKPLSRSENAAKHQTINWRR